jgi:hypothetical protein
MKKSLISVLASIILVSGIAWAAGSYAPYGLRYIPQKTTQGTTDYTAIVTNETATDALLHSLSLDSLKLTKFKTLGDVGYETLAAAVATAGSTSITVIVPSGNWVSGGVTVPSTMALVVEKGGYFTVATGTTLTINGFYNAGLYQTFSLTGTGKAVFGPGAVDKIYPQWWGAKADGVTDNSAAIQAAFDSIPLASYYGWRVHFVSGTYYVASTINLPTTVADWANGAYTTVSITGDGATLYTDQANVSILKRWPPDAVSSPNRYANTSFKVDGLNFRGTRLRGQVGLDLGATYGPRITNCNFDYLGRGLRLSYAMVPYVGNCKTHNCSVAGFTNTSSYLWTNVNDTFNTNTGTFENCRAYVNDTDVVAIEGISKANPAVVTWTAHGLETGDIVFMDLLSQDAEWATLNKRRFQITKLTDDTFSIQTLNRTHAGADFDTSAFADPFTPDGTGVIQWATFGWEEINTYNNILDSCVVEGNGATDKIFFYSPANAYNPFFTRNFHSEGVAYGSEIYINNNGSIIELNDGFGSLYSDLTVDCFDMLSATRASIKITNYLATAGSNQIRLPADSASSNISWNISGLGTLGDGTNLSLGTYWYGGVPPTKLTYYGHYGAPSVSAYRMDYLPWLGIYVKQDPNQVGYTGASFKGLRVEGNNATGGGVGVYDPTNAQAIMVKQKTLEHTCTAGATNTLTNFIPAGAMVVGFSVRVTEVLSSAGAIATFTVTEGANVWLTGISKAVNSTGSLANSSMTAPKIYAAATSVVITPNAAFDGVTGKIRITVHYIVLEVPSS